MPYDKSRTLGRVPATLLAALITWLLVLAFAERAQAIPTFARKYRTSCITCHTVFPKLSDVGEAFRRNGYQFPTDDDFLVKDEPISFGGDAYKEMFPNSIWPSDMPTLPPVFVRGILREQFHTDPKSNGLKWRQDMPYELVLGGGGTLGPNISAWWEIEWEPHEGNADTPVVERGFLQFSNLFAWTGEDDDDGMREGHHWLTVAPHAMNLKIGRFTPGVLPHYWNGHLRPGIEQFLDNSRKTGNGLNKLNFGTQSAAVELHGILAQYNSYAVGFANGGLVGNMASGGDVRDDNNHKDVYFRLGRKWFGYPLDGVIGSADLVDDTTVEDQGPDESIYSPGLDWWRAVGFETGVFGWWGRAQIAQPSGEHGEDFRRIGGDARLQYFDLDLFGLFIWGNDEFGGDAALMGEDFYLYGIGAEYMIKPWIMAQCRYEELVFNEVARQSKEEGRVIPGVIFQIRQNLKLQAEWVVDTTDRDTGGRAATDELRFQLDWAY